MLTDAGFDYANVEGIVRVRIGEGALPADELGLAADTEKSAEFRRPVRVIVAGRDDVYVVDDIAGLTAVTQNGELASVTLAFDNPGTWSDAVDRVRGLASTFGWDQNADRRPRRSSSPTSTATAPATPSRRSSGRLTAARASPQRSTSIAAAERRP